MKKKPTSRRGARKSDTKRYEREAMYLTEGGSALVPMKRSPLASACSKLAKAGVLVRQRDHRTITGIATRTWGYRRATKPPMTPQRRSKTTRSKVKAVKAKVLYDGDGWIAPSTAKYKWKQFVNIFQCDAPGDIKVRVRVILPLPTRRKK